MLLQELSKYTPFVSSSYKNQGYRDLQKKKKKKKKEGRRILCFKGLANTSKPRHVNGPYYLKKKKATNKQKFPFFLL